MVRIRLRVRYHQRAIPWGVVALMLLAVGSLATLAFSQAFATAPSPLSSAGVTADMRQFYLSSSAASGMDADTLCVAGYHFASMWEIADPSNLQYNTSLGRTSDDSGEGPPTQLPGNPWSTPARGWVRTGWVSSGAAVAGQGNCNAWSSDDGAHSGTVAHLVSDWIADEEDVGPWNAEVRTCDWSVRVWCVQDHGFLPVFLPLVIKSH